MFWELLEIISFYAMAIQIKCVHNFENLNLNLTWAMAHKEYSIESGDFGLMDYKPCLMLDLLFNPGLT